MDQNNDRYIRYILIPHSMIYTYNYLIYKNLLSNTTLIILTFTYIHLLLLT